MRNPYQAFWQGESRVFLWKLAVGLGGALVGCWLIWGAAQEETAKKPLIFTINGHALPNVTTSLITDIPYGPADAFAQIIGAYYSQVGNSVIFEYAGNLITLPVYPDAAQAGANAYDIQVSGASHYGYGAISQPDGVYVPAQALAAAMGAGVDYIPGQHAVYVVTGRAMLSVVQTPQNSSQERFVLQLSHPAKLEAREITGLGVVSYRFEQTEIIAEQEYTSQLVDKARLRYLGTASSGYVEFRLNLTLGARAQMYTTPSGQGVDVIIDIVQAVPEQQAAQTEVQHYSSLQTVPERPETPEVSPAPTLNLGGALSHKIVIDPGHGSTLGGVPDAGIHFAGQSPEQDLTLQLAKQLEQQLQTRGIYVQLTRDQGVSASLDVRHYAAVGAPLFISLHAAPLAQGRYNLYYLGEAETSEQLDLAIRRNSEKELATLVEIGQSETDKVRRSVLLNFLPDLAQGEQLANQVISGLNQNPYQYQINNVEALPLYVLSGAAGRGLMFEFSPQDLQSPQLAEALTKVLEPLITR